MDINMPKMNGIKAAQQIREMFPETAIIGLSVQTEREGIEKMKAAGISSYLTKESTVETSREAIEEAA
ncbi:MAG: response regulator [Nitrospirota bacterium]